MLQSKVNLNPENKNSIKTRLILSITCIHQTIKSSIRVDETEPQLKCSYYFLFKCNFGILIYCILIQVHIIKHFCVIFYNFALKDVTFGKPDL